MLSSAKLRGVLLGLTMVLNLTTFAHESRPLFLEITEIQPGIFELKYKIPSSVPDFNLPEVFLPSTFNKLSELAIYRTGDGFMKRQKFQSEAGLYGVRIEILYPILNPSISTIIKVNLLNGQQFNQLLSPKELSWVVPEEERRYAVAKQYTILGIQHILGGWDHLLFLICLIIVAGIGRKMLITITGFTLAHSVTLVMSTLGWVNLPIPPVEAIIALSVVFLASEIALGNKESWTYRYPIAVSSSFGLLHGFGFASVLSDIGLPQTEVPTSLLFFNVGVELGQIMFLAVVILIYRLAIWMKGYFNSFPSMEVKMVEKMSAYVIGSIASFWMIERLVGFLN